MRILLYVILLFFVSLVKVDANMLNESDVFRNLKVEGSKGNYLVSGEARTTKGEFYYSVEDGHMEFLKERKVLTKAGEWKPFKIEVRIPINKLPQNASLIFILYERDAKGQIINTFPIILERFP